MSEVEERHQPLSERPAGDGSTPPEGAWPGEERVAGDRDPPAERPPAPPFSWPPPPPAPDEQRPGAHEFHHPLDRVTGRLPRRLRIIVDWVVTIVGAVAIVLAVKAWVVNPYRIPSSSMEPTLHCARPAAGCEARFSDRVLANRFVFHFREPERGEIVVFETPPKVERECNAGGTFVKRIVGLPGETLQIRVVRGREYVYIDGQRLEEPYVQPDKRGFGPAETFRIPDGQYFLMGDNRAQSCDSRQWGGLPRRFMVGPVFMTYWPPNRISFR